MLRCRLWIVLLTLLANTPAHAQDGIPVSDLKKTDSLYRLLPMGTPYRLRYGRKTTVDAEGYNDFTVSDTAALQRMAGQNQTSTATLVELFRLLTQYQLSGIRFSDPVCRATTLLETGRQYDHRGYFIQHAGHCSDSLLWTYTTEKELTSNIRYGSWDDNFSPRKIKDTITEPVSRWPYWQRHVPPFIGINAGLEGFPFNRWSLGIVHNLFFMSNQGNSIPGARMGYGLYYKKNTEAAEPWSLEADLGIYALLAFGLNVNLNVFEGKSITGFKPFIGLSLLGIDVLYGYNFFQQQNNTGDLLRHHTFTLRLSIPLFKLTKRKTVTHSVYGETNLY